jgi:2-methylisocitrate lyase-like PEP mutase family enzyme
MADPADKRAAFRRLHEAGCFVMPNPWDAGTAAALENVGFKALASTSAGMAWSLGRPDGGVTLDEVLAHLRMLDAATSLPLNADFENGFADDPSGVAVNVAKAVQTGVAGLSIEDYTGDRANPLYDFSLAVERIAAAREAIDAAGGGVVLTGRAEGFLRGRPDLDDTLRRLQAYAEAGADCLYAPLLVEEAQIRAAVEAVAPKAVNILAMSQPVAELAALGVRRISLGSGLASVAWGAFLRAAGQIASEGSFASFADGAGGRVLNPLFAARSPG